MSKQTKQKRVHVFQAKKTGNVVRLVRYFSNNPGIADYKATFVCDLNYNTMIADVYSSVCTPEDNFNKDKGVQYALSRVSSNDGFSINFTKDMPIVDQILNELISLCVLKDESQFVKLPSKEMKNALTNLI